MKGLGAGGGGDEGLKVEGGFTFGRLQGGLKGASRGLEGGGLEGGFKGASRGLEGGFKGGFKGRLHALKGASRGLSEVWACVKYVPKQSIPKHFEHELHQRFGHV